MIIDGDIFQLKLTLTDSSPKIWRRVLAPDECTLGDLHYLISFSFGWFDDSEHEFSAGSRVFGPRNKDGRAKAEDEHKVVLLDLLKDSGDKMHYVYHRRDAWRVDVVFEGAQAPVPNGLYPCCIAGANDGPCDGVGGIAQYNELVRLVNDPAARRAIAPNCDEVGWSDFVPTYLDIGDINGMLVHIFREPSGPNDEKSPLAR